MNTEIGKFLEGRLLETINLLKTIYDVGLGSGKDVSVEIDGREMVFKKDGSTSRGFMRITPLEVSAILALPRGHEIPDPMKRFKGPHGSETKHMVYHPGDIDPYVRRMIAAAYAMEEAAEGPPGR